MPWVKSESTFRDFLSLVIVHAPDEFPQEDYLVPHEQLTLELAFAELRQGIEFLSTKRVSRVQKEQLQTLLTLALAKYRERKDIEGAHILQDLETKAFEHA